MTSLTGRSWKPEVLIIDMSIVETHETLCYGILGDGSHISTNQKRENSAPLLRIGRNLRLYRSTLHIVAIPSKNAEEHKKPLLIGM